MKRCSFLALCPLSFLILPACGASSSGTTTDASPKDAEQLSGLLIDDFEDGDGVPLVGEGWYAYVDDTNGGLSSVTYAGATPYAAHTMGTVAMNGAGYQSTKSLEVSYTFDKSDTMIITPYVGVGVSMGSATTPFDASKYTGVAYTYKGGAHRVSIQTTEVTDYDFFGMSVPAAGTWTTVLFPMNNLTQQYFSSFFTGNTGTTSLPIKLIYFRAKLNGDHVNLDWATAAEINNDFFTVERSEDGVNFESLLTKPGAGNSTSNLYYNAIDGEPLSNGYSYYRLKQTDFDGHYSYSNIQSIKNGGGKDDLAPEIKIESVAPNPFDEVFKLGFVLKAATVVDLQIFNLSGQIVYATKVSTVDGYNNYEFRDETGLPKGIYFVNLSYADQRVTQKIVKQ